jgi:hypothetical protein
MRSLLAVGIICFFVNACSTDSPATGQAPSSNDEAGAKTESNAGGSNTNGPTNQGGAGGVASSSDGAVASGSDAASASDTNSPPRSDGGQDGSIAEWDRFEIAVSNSKTYADPFRDVTLNVTYTRPDGSHVDFWGFYDGGTTWRLRFMPDATGAWTYKATFSDGSPGVAGAFQCVHGDLPGLIGHDEVNPIWFGFRGGRHQLMRSFHAGDRFFASNWPSASRVAFLDWAQAQGYNMLGIASHYLNRNIVDRGQGWNTPDLWDGPTRALRPAEYQRMETVLSDLAARRMVVFPFAGFFGKASDFPLDHADQELYLRYTLARVAAYWNLLFAVAGPEPLLAGETNQWREAMGMAEISRLGTLTQSLNVFQHLVTVHNVIDQNAFKGEAWESYTTLQGPKTVDRHILSAGLLSKHAAKPLYAYELLWPGNTVGHPPYSDVDIRKNGFVMIMSGTTINFGDMNGNSSSGFSGTMNLADKVQSRHDIIKRVWDFFEKIELYKLSPHQDLVSNGFCLADPGREYLVYLEGRGSVSVTATGGPYQVEWINAQNTTDVRAMGSTPDGKQLASPAEGDDWILHLKK